MLVPAGFALSSQQANLLADYGCVEALSDLS
jgi:hypothetical protein